MSKNKESKKNTEKKVEKTEKKIEKETKRLLTSSEIDEVLSFLNPNEALPADVGNAIYLKNKRRLIAQLEKIEIFPSLIPKLKEEMEIQYYKTIIQPGESVGILTAQSIGERQTQQTLNTFHSAGMAIKTVITGVPRFTELLNATKEPKARSCQVFFKENNDSIAHLRDMVGDTMREFKFRHLYKSYSVHENVEREDWFDIFDAIYEKDYGSENNNMCIIFEMDKELLFEYKISLFKIAERLEESYQEITCIFSPDYLGKFLVFVNTSQIEPKDEDMTQEESYQYHIRDIVLPSLNEIQICGITGVVNIFFDKKGSEWIVDTEGSNFQEILGLNIVDKTRVISNDMWEIYHTLGIEAARNFLISEFSSVISSDGTFVNDSHIILLVDVMTFTGNINSISRYGLKKENCGPMAKASFEESLENFLKAGIFGEKESTNGVSASVMLGKVPRIGTGLCDVLVNINALPKLPKILEDKVLESTNSEED